MNSYNKVWDYIEEIIKEHGSKDEALTAQEILKELERKYDRRSYPEPEKIAIWAKGHDDIKIGKCKVRTSVRYSKRNMYEWVGGVSG